MFLYFLVDILLPWSILWFGWNFNWKSRGFQWHFRILWSHTFHDFGIWQRQIFEANGTNSFFLLALFLLSNQRRWWPKMNWRQRWVCFFWVCVCVYFWLRQNEKPCTWRGWVIKERCVREWSKRVFTFDKLDDGIAYGWAIKGIANHQTYVWKEKLEIEKSSSRCV